MIYCLSKTSNSGVVSGSSFSVSPPNNKPTNKIFFFYSALKSAVVNISSS